MRQQVAYQKLDGITFNILNQTKMLFTALFVQLDGTEPLFCAFLVHTGFGNLRYKIRPLDLYYKIYYTILFY